MNGCFLLVSDVDIDGLLADPSQVVDLLDARVWQADSSPDYLDIDRTWHALHFLLTGTADGRKPPLDFIYTGGTPIGDEDVVYDPARALRSSELARLSMRLQRIDTPTLLSRFDGPRMDALELYPAEAGGWTRLCAAKDERMAFFTEAYERLVALVARGAQERRGMLVWIA